MMIRLKLQVQMAGLFTYSHEKGLLTFNLADVVQYKKMIYIAQRILCAPNIVPTISDGPLLSARISRSNS
jgi:hypothetical protein